MGRRTLTPEDVGRVVKALPKDLRLAIESAEGDLFVCGGFVRDVCMGDEPKDIDVFGKDAEYVKRAALILGAGRPDGSKATVYSITVTDPALPIQFVWTWPVATAQVAIDRMDFTMCQAAVWYKDGAWRSACAPEFYSDLETKRLRYTWPEREGTAGRSLVRATRFVERGWKFPADEIAKIVAHVGLEVTEPDVAKVGLGGDLRETYVSRYRRNVSGIYPIGAERSK